MGFFFKKKESGNKQKKSWMRIVSRTEEGGPEENRFLSLSKIGEIRFFWGDWEKNYIKDGIFFFSGFSGTKIDGNY